MDRKDLLLVAPHVLAWTCSFVITLATPLEGPLLPRGTTTCVGGALGYDPLGLWSHPPSETAQEQEPDAHDEEYPLNRNVGAWAETVFARTSLFNHHSPAFERYPETPVTLTDDSKLLSSFDTICGFRADLKISNTDTANLDAAPSPGPLLRIAAALALLSIQSRSPRFGTAISRSSSPLSQPSPFSVTGVQPARGKKPPVSDAAIDAAMSTSSDSMRNSTDAHGFMSASTSPLAMSPMGSFAPDEPSHHSGPPRYGEYDPDKQHSEYEDEKEEEEKDDEEKAAKKVLRSWIFARTTRQHMCFFVTFSVPFDPPDLAEAAKHKEPRSRQGIVHTLDRSVEFADLSDYDDTCCSVLLDSLFLGFTTHKMSNEVESPLPKGASLRHISTIAPSTADSLRAPEIGMSSASLIPRLKEFPPSPSSALAVAARPRRTSGFSRRLDRRAPSSWYGDGYCVHYSRVNSEVGQGGQKVHQQAATRIVSYITQNADPDDPLG
ncbi:hypothetical protein BDK51DRAFT_44590 [Blyttiomyces helicus]|uniref:Uncharacterized protein n=1 Tax=Blyttiomyces helicus TaxID=388810 RepID=A0A4V1ISE1_9FUNG|nr:hypothetical protein BDK51DRAFT_44590 [Blyttiomyces helicus]|eukprot:RKO93237.1 hypothetical protein BDK51DRAFT_44590 [Blyttiomyces helicus]